MAKAKVNRVSGCRRAVILLYVRGAPDYSGSTSRMVTLQSVLPVTLLFRPFTQGHLNPLNPINGSYWGKFITTSSGYVISLYSYASAAGVSLDGFAPLPIGGA